MRTFGIDSGHRGRASTAAAVVAGSMFAVIVLAGCSIPAAHPARAPWHPPAATTPAGFFSGVPKALPSPPKIAGQTVSENCEWKTSTIRLADAPELLYVPAESPTGPRLRFVQMRRSTSACAPASFSAFWYATSGDQVTRTLQLSRYTSSDSGTLHVGRIGNRIAPPVTVDVHGSTGDLFYEPDITEGQVFWTAADGSHWVADFDNVSIRAGMKAVRSIVIDGTRADPRQSPAGFPLPLAPSTANAPKPDPADFAWHRYSPCGGLVTQPQAGDSVLRVGSRRVDINGQDGWWFNDDTTVGTNDEVIQSVDLGWLLPDGSVARVLCTAPQSLPALVRRATALARTVVKVSADDPALNVQ